MNTTAYIVTIVMFIVMFIFGVSGWIVAASAIRSWESERQKMVKWREIFQ